MLGNRTRQTFAFPLTTAITLAALLVPALVFGVGITYAPGAVLSDIHSQRPNLSVLTFEVPGGLIVADRISQAYLVLLDGPTAKAPTRAELAALITLQKKVQAIWGDGADNTDTRTET